MAEKFKMPKARSMTYAERKKFKATGLDQLDVNDKEGVLDRQDELVDWVIENIYPEVKAAIDEDGDAVFYGDMVKLTQDTIILTMGQEPDAVKNLLMSGRGK